MFFPSTLPPSLTCPELLPVLPAPFMVSALHRCTTVYLYAASLLSLFYVQIRSDTPILTIVLQYLVQ